LFYAFDCDFSFPAKNAIPIPKNKEV